MFRHLFTIRSQKTQGFCVADFVNARRSRSKIFPLFIWIKEPCVRKFEGLERSKRRGISQTKSYFGHLFCDQHLTPYSNFSFTLNGMIDDIIN